MKQTADQPFLGSSPFSPGASAVLRRFARPRPTSAPTKAPQNPATCAIAGAKLALSAASDTAQNPTKLSPATFMMLDVLGIVVARRTTIE